MQKRKLAALTTLLFFSLLVLAPVAQATPSKVLIRGKGTWTVTGGDIIEVEKETEDELILLMWHTYKADGILEGTWFGVLQRIVFEFDKGRLKGEELEAYISGTVGKGRLKGEPFFVNVEDEWTMDLATGWLEGPFEISGTIGDKNVEGQGRYWGNLGFTGEGEYEVEIWQV